MLEKWTPVETLPPLGEDELQIWRLDLPDEATSPERILHLLVPEESARAARLRAGRVRLQFVVARAVLRTLLGNCLALNPTDVPITLTSFGKPETAGVFFNVAHSGDAVLIALCRKHRVGIDIEFFKRDIDALDIAKHSFSLREQRALSSIVDATELQQAFFRCWTRKEAIIKADGRGLSLPLDSFEVPVQEGALDTQVIVPMDGTTNASSYYLSDIAHGDETAAAFAISAPHYSARTFLFPLEAVAQKA